MQTYLKGPKWRIVFTLPFLLIAVPAGARSTFETSAPAAVMVDFNTGAVLFEKNADSLRPPASLTKLMTAEVVFEEIRQGRIKLEDEFTVSERAWREGGANSGGSTMFLPVRSKAKVADLLRGLLIQSGNDAAIVLAEGIAGSEEAFAQRMTRRARELGLTHSQFRNPHGLGDPEHHVSMRDMASLAAHIIRDHPKMYKILSEEEFTYNGIRQHNRNPLLPYGADGLKTGYLSEAGYALVASMKRDERRLILAIAGLSTPDERRDEARKLLDWGFRTFENISLYRAGAPVGNVEILAGAEARVPVVTKEDVVVTRPRGDEVKERISATETPRFAPVEVGERLGSLIVSVADTPIKYKFAVFAAEGVAPASFLNRAWTWAGQTVQDVWARAWSGDDGGQAAAHSAP